MGCIALRNSSLECRAPKALHILDAPRPACWNTQVVLMLWNTIRAGYPWRMRSLCINKHKNRASIPSTLREAISGLSRDACNQRESSNVRCQKRSIDTQTIHACVEVSISICRIASDRWLSMLTQLSASMSILVISPDDFYRRFAEKMPFRPFRIFGLCTPRGSGAAYGFFVVPDRYP